MSVWYRQIDGAGSSLELVNVIRDYVAGWSPAEMARLPSACRPGRIRDEHDVETLHECLVDEYRITRASGEDLALLQQLTSIVVRACIRLAELRVVPSGSNAPTTGPMKAAARGEKN